VHLTDDERDQLIAEGTIAVYAAPAPADADTNRPAVTAAGQEPDHDTDADVVGDGWDW
jgi:hypothetical protein